MKPIWTNLNQSEIWSIYKFSDYQSEMNLNQSEANLKPIWNLIVKSEIWTVNLNQSEPIWNLKFLQFFWTTSLKWIWKQSEANLKSEKSIWNWTRGKVNLTQSETELEGNFNQTKSETEIKGAFWTRLQWTRLADTIRNWHRLIQPQLLQSHTRVWKECC